MIRLWIISCKLNPSHKINALNLPQFHPPTPPPKSELPGNGNVSLEASLPLFLQITFPSSLDNWLQVRGTGGSWEMQKVERTEKGRYLFPSLCFNKLTPSNGCLIRFLAFTGWVTLSVVSRTLAITHLPFIPPALVAVVGSYRC